MGRRLPVLLSSSQSLGPSCTIYRGSVRLPQDCTAAVKHTVETFGKLTILINAAAGNFLSSARDLTPNGFSAVVSTDLLGTFNMCHSAFPYLSSSSSSQPSSPSPCIVNISATLHHPATFYQSHASASKAGVDSLTRSLALEWGPLSIRVNGVAPGPIGDTEGMRRLGPGEEAAREIAGERIPMGRMGRKKDIGYAVLYLVSDAAGWVTGETVVVDGGEKLYRGEQIFDEDTVRSMRAKL
jgi:2,4-dienoyl-CoA reductase [(3E)-enoyl-CoA-producing], peroxisomal